MKKLLVCAILSIFTLVNFSKANDWETARSETFNNAVTWAYTKKLTIYLQPEDFGFSKTIRRDEAAKFFVNFAKLIGKANYTVNANQCNFSDKNQARDDLQDTIVEACRLGLFKGAHGKFYPTGNLTNAEAIAVLVRLVDGYQVESGSHRAENYYERARALNLLSHVNMSTKNIPAQRGEVLITLYNAREMNEVTNVKKLNPYTKYTNQKLGISFEYPSEWNITEEVESADIDGQRPSDIIHLVGLITNDTSAFMVLCSDTPSPARGGSRGDQACGVAKEKSIVPLCKRYEGCKTKTNAKGIEYITFRRYNCQGLDCQEDEYQRTTYYVLYHPYSFTPGIILSDESFVFDGKDITEVLEHMVNSIQFEGTF